MRDKDKSKEQLILELNALRQRVANLETLETEHQRVEGELHKSEEKFRTLASQSPNMIFINLHGRVIYVNQRCIEEMGYSEDEFYSPAFDFLSLITPKDRDMVKSNFARHMSGKDVPSYDYTLLTKNGEELEVILTSKLIDYEGQTAILGTITDITERKKTEQALKESEETLRLIFENAYDGISIYEEIIGRRSRRLIDCNRRYAEMAGRSKEELLNLENTSQAQKNMGPVHTQEENIIIRQEKLSYKGLISWIRPDNKKNIIEYTAAPIQLGNRALTVGIDRDITEWVRTQEILEHRAAQLEALHQIGLNLIQELELSSLLQSIVTQAVELLNGERGGLYLYHLDRNVLEMEANSGEGGPAVGTIVHPGQGVAGRVWESGQTLIVNDYAQWEGRNEALVKVVGKVSTIGVPILWGGTVRGVLAIAANPNRRFSPEDTQLLNMFATQAAVAVLNATYHQEIQAHAIELEQRVAERTRALAAANEQLKELDQLKTKFISDITHELRTPLTNLVLYVELLERGKPDKQPTYIAILKDKIKQLVQLTEDVIIISKLDQIGSVDFTAVNLNELSQQIVSEQAAQAEAAGLELTFEGDENLSLIGGEVDQLAQALTQLVNNAIIYTPNGRVHITIRNDSKDQGIQLRVEDSGIGIIDKDMPHVFDRFYRGERIGQFNIPGTGLGLAVVKEIITLHGGTIQVESKVGQGSIFTIWLPAYNKRTTDLSKEQT